MDINWLYRENVSQPQYHDSIYLMVSSISFALNISISGADAHIHPQLWHEIIGISMIKNVTTMEEPRYAIKTLLYTRCSHSISSKKNCKFIEKHYIVILLSFSSLLVIVLDGCEMCKTTIVILLLSIGLYYFM